MSTTAVLSDLLPAESLLSVDSMDFTATGSVPEALVAPSTADEAAALMRWATANGLGVLPIGLGSSLGPVAPERRWIALTTRRMAEVEIYEAADLTISIGAGSRVADVDSLLRGERQWLPFDPPRRDGRTVGGLVSDGWSGPLWAGYGELRNHVLGATLVTGDGRVLRLGGRVVKNVAGYDLIKPLVGSTGSLGLMTSICLRAFPEPAVDRLLMGDAGELPEIVETARRVATAPVMPASAVLVDRAPSGEGAAMLVRLHGAEATVDADRKSIEQHLGSALREVPADGLEEGHYLSAVRDRGTIGSIRLRTSGLPSRLSACMDAITRLQPRGFLVDLIGGGADIALDTTEPDRLRAFATEVESMGGALRIVTAPRGDAAWGLGSRAAEGGAELAAAVRAAFDPADTLWPAHR